MHRAHTWQGKGKERTWRQPPRAVTYDILGSNQLGMHANCVCNFWLSLPWRALQFPSLGKQSVVCVMGHGILRAPGGGGAAPHPMAAGGGQNAPPHTSMFEPFQQHFLQSMQLTIFSEFGIDNTGGLDKTAQRLPCGIGNIIPLPMHKETPSMSKLVF